MYPISWVTVAIVTSYILSSSIIAAIESQKQGNECKKGKRCCKVSNLSVSSPFLRKRASRAEKLQGKSQACDERGCISGRRFSYFSRGEKRRPKICLRSQATKPFGLASPFSCRSHVTSHDIPEMKSLLARFHYTSCIKNSHLMIIFSAIMHFGGDLIWNFYYYIKQLNWIERSHIFQISPSVASSESTDSPFSGNYKVKQSRRVNPRKYYHPQSKLLETFRFEDEGHYKGEISLESFLRSLKK